MTLRFRITGFCGAAAALLAGVSPAVAQTARPPQMQGALFGVTDDRPAGDARPLRHALDFALTLVQGNDSDVPVALRGLVQPDLFVGGPSTVFMGSGEYRWQGPRMQVLLGGASGLRYYNRLEDLQPISHSGGLTVSGPVGRRTSILARQTVSYAPSHLFFLFPNFAASSPAEQIPGVPVAEGEEIAPASPLDIAPTLPDYAVDNSESLSYVTNVTFTRGLSRRSRLSFTGEFEYVDFTSAGSLRPDLRSQGARAEYAHNLSQHTAVTVGYRIRHGAFGDVALLDNVSATEHLLDVGVEYTRPISGTRMLVVSVNGGSSMVSADALGDQRLRGLSGDAGVTWHFAPHWQLRGVARRGFEYAAGLSEPIYVNGFSAELAGLLTPRLDVLLSSRYSAGRSAIFQEALTFDTRGADVRLRYALFRGLAVYGEYLHYFYDFTEAARLAPGIPTGLRRNGVRAGVMVLVPAIRR